MSGVKPVSRVVAESCILPPRHRNPHGRHFLREKKIVWRVYVLVIWIIRCSGRKARGRYQSAMNARYINIYILVYIYGRVFPREERKNMLIGKVTVSYVCGGEGAQSACIVCAASAVAFLSA